MCHTGWCHWYVIKKTSQFEMPKANIYGPWEMEIAIHYDIWTHQQLLAETGGNYKNSRNHWIGVFSGQYLWKMNQSCDFVADKNTQSILGLPQVLFDLGNTNSHAVNPEYQLLRVQQRLFFLIYVWENHSNNSWKIALAQSLQASNQHVYQETSNMHFSHLHMARYCA